LLATIDDGDLTVFVRPSQKCNSHFPSSHCTVFSSKLYRPRCVRVTARRFVFSSPCSSPETTTVHTVHKNRCTMPSFGQCRTESSKYVDFFHLISPSLVELLYIIHAFCLLPKRPLFSFPANRTRLNSFYSMSRPVSDLCLLCHNLKYVRHVHAVPMSECKQYFHDRIFKYCHIGYFAIFYCSYEKYVVILVDGRSHSELSIFEQRVSIGRFCLS